MIQQTIDASMLALLENTRQGFALLLRQGGMAGAPSACQRAAEDSRAELAVRLARRILAPEGALRQAPAPLCSVFTHMNGHHPGHFVPVEPVNGTLQMPVQEVDSGALSAGAERLWSALAAELRSVALTETGLLDALAALEVWSSAVPALTCTMAQPDVSLFDESKLLAAVAACICEQMAAQNWTAPEEDLLSQPLFLLFSADFSGIQRFIYTISTENALRTLRSRSFVLELLLEHYLDELLTGCGVSRANLLYSGGGHCYVLLPNTPAVGEVCAAWTKQVNDWLRERFGALLYLAAGWTPCTGDELNNRPEAEQPYRAVFQRLSGEIARRKLRRFDAAELLQLNRRAMRTGGRECRVCGQTEHLRGDTCRMCGYFEALSREIQQEDLVAVTRTPLSETALALPALGGTVYLQFRHKSSQLPQGQLCRLYQKRSRAGRLPGAIPLCVGDYSAGNQLSELAGQSQGIRRLGVCRMDVDDLGHAFVSGYGGSPRGGAHLVSLMRTAAFSRQLSLFFKAYINEILSGAWDGGAALRVSLVYAGGDDVFLLGAWGDVIQAAGRIAGAFHTFSCGSLTISGGIGIFDDHFPIRYAAEQTGELEAASKNLPGKNAVTLFQPAAEHTYPWDRFQSRVMGEKLDQLSRFFDQQDERGMSFLYRILSLLRAATEPEGKLNLARLAYLLSRLEPPKRSERWEPYRRLSQQMYRWACDREERRELITAIYIYVYQNRKRRQESDGKSDE